MVADGCVRCPVLFHESTGSMPLVTYCDVWRRDPASPLSALVRECWDLSFSVSLFDCRWP